MPTSDPMTSSTEYAGEDGEGDDGKLCTCGPADNAAQESKQLPTEQGEEREEAAEELNSDDDEEGDTDEPGAVTNWTDPSEFVEKTQCAFNFNNSVIFDLDD